VNEASTSAQQAQRLTRAELPSHPCIHWHRPSGSGQRSQRIVSLVPSLSEALAVLGLGDRLVGVTEYCVHPKQAFEGLPRVGGTKDADVEAIAALTPDLVIANQEENTARVVRALAAREIDVWVSYPRTVREGLTLLEDLAALGASKAAVERVVKPVRMAVEEAEARRASPGASGSKVFCPIWRDPWMTISQDTYIHDLLELCGGQNLFADLGVSGSESGRRYPILDLEQLVAAQPEVILLPDEPYAFGSTDVETLARLDIPAAGSGRIHLIDGTLVSWYGPRIAEAIRVLAGFIANSRGAGAAP
jgi:ABC-type Fe3+-hydroxamate transport system substrate-binding protein